MSTATITVSYYIMYIKDTVINTNHHLQLYPSTCVGIRQTKTVHEMLT